MVAAGGNFDPAAWTNSAWRDGAGILPLPLKTEPVGRIPDESAGTIEPFYLSPETFTADAFQIPDASREELDDLYRERRRGSRIACRHLEVLDDCFPGEAISYPHFGSTALGGIDDRQRRIGSVLACGLLDLGAWVGLGLMHLNRRFESRGVELTFDARHRFDCNLVRRSYDDDLGGRGQRPARDGEHRNGER
jgi:hypothetical protein